MHVCGITVFKAAGRGWWLMHVGGITLRPTSHLAPAALMQPRCIAG
jgi:hypothetical protein